MKTDSQGMPRLDKTAIVVETLDTLTDDSTFLATQTPEARLAALELMRRINYGDAATGRLQRVLEVVEHQWKDKEPGRVSARSNPSDY